MMLVLMRKKGGHGGYCDMGYDIIIMVDGVKMDECKNAAVLFVWFFSSNFAFFMVFPRFHFF